MSPAFKWFLLFDNLRSYSNYCPGMTQPGCYLAKQGDWFNLYRGLGLVDQNNTIE